jgi:hypothetical protein
MSLSQNLGNIYATVTHGCCGELFVFDKRFESCKVLENDIEHPVVKLKEKNQWKKPSFIGGIGLFNFRRRREALNLSPSDYVDFYKSERSTYIQNDSS